MTLTSPKSPKRIIKKSLDVLKKRIARVTVEKNGFLDFTFNRYFCLRTSAEGKGVLHIIYWGRFVPQRMAKFGFERFNADYREGCKEPSL